MIDEAQKARALDRFACNATELRRRADLSQRDVGLRAGLHRTEVSMLERRLRIPRLETILRIAGAVKAQPGELLEGLSWNLDPGRLWDRRSEPGRYEVVVAGQHVTWTADGWKKAAG